MEQGPQQKMMVNLFEIMILILFAVNLIPIGGSIVWDCLNMSASYHMSGWVLNTQQESLLNFGNTEINFFGNVQIGFGENPKNLSLPSPGQYCNVFVNGSILRNLTCTTRTMPPMNW